MVTIALETLASCSGCEVSILDLHEEILELLNNADIVYAPVLMDTKEIPEVDIAIVSGSVRNQDNQAPEVTAAPRGCCAARCGRPL